MCGIFGMIRQSPFSSNELLQGLKRLEYRGYDSFGFASNTGELTKHIGSISDFIDKINQSEATTGISHTRWATHGGVTLQNSHPHSDCNERFFVVHNGIIENYEELKNELLSRGHVFKSQTDTEVIPHFIEEHVKSGLSIEDAIKMFIKISKGTFAVLLMEKNKNIIYAMKRDSPLVLGLMKDGFAIASDIYAFSNITNRVIFFDDNEYAIINQNDFGIYDSYGKQIKKDFMTFSWNKEENLGNYEHYMIKEIIEEPVAIERLINSLNNEQHDTVEKISSLIKIRKVLFVACGTAYHASLLGTSFLRFAGINADAVIASEYQNYMADKNTCVIAVSQSGETMDVIKALQAARASSAVICSIVNVPHSTIERMSSLSINIKAGQEICVASTKVFTGQAAAILYLSGAKIVTLQKLLDSVIKQKDVIKKISEDLCKARDIYVLGKSEGYALAREIALKIKEISYIHAEGMMAGELKHGTIALIEPGVPVISIIFNNNEDMISSTKETEARGADIFAITNKPYPGKWNFVIDSEDKKLFFIAAGTVGQLIAYYTAKALGRPIDKPRNLAKSVTVK